MEYEWDEAKRLANLRKHGIDFIDIPTVIRSVLLCAESDRPKHDKVGDGSAIASYAIL